MTKIEQYNHRLNDIEREIELIQRAADDWDYTGQSNRPKIINQVLSDVLDLVTAVRWDEGEVVVWFTRAYY